MTVDEAITLFKQVAESQIVDKEDFINDCVVLFLEGLTAEEAIRKTRNKRIRQTYEKKRFAKPIISDEGEDVSDNFYFVDQSTIEHNDGNYLPKEADKLSTAIILTNALRRKNPTTFFHYRRICKKNGKTYVQKDRIENDSEFRFFKRNNRIVNTNFKVLIHSALFMYPKKEMKEWLRYHERKKR